MPASFVLALTLAAQAAAPQAAPPGPPVRSLVVGSQRIVLGSTPLARAARGLRGSVRPARRAGAAGGTSTPSACFTTADRGVLLVLEGGAGGVVASFAVHTVTDSSQISGCTRLRLRERQIATGDGLKLGRLRADVEHLLGGAGRDSGGVAVYAYRGPWNAPVPTRSRTASGWQGAPAAAAPRTATGTLHVEYQGDTVSAFSGTLTIG